MIIFYGSPPRGKNFIETSPAVVTRIFDAEVMWLNIFGYFQMLTRPGLIFLMQCHMGGQTLINTL